MNRYRFKKWVRILFSHHYDESVENFRTFKIHYWNCSSICTKKEEHYILFRQRIIMRRETKEYIYKNAGVITFALFIIIAILISDLLDIAFEEFKLALVLFAFFIILQVFSQAMQYEPDKTRKKVQKLILALVVLLFLILILIFFILYSGFHIF